MTLVGAAALGGSAVAFAVDAELLVFAFAALLGLSITLIRPALQALLPSLARTPRSSSQRTAPPRRSSLGTLVGPLIAGVLVSVADAGLVFALGSGCCSWLRSSS